MSLTKWDPVEGDPKAQIDALTNNLEAAIAAGNEWKRKAEDFENEAADQRVEMGKAFIERDALALQNRELRKALKHIQTLSSESFDHQPDHVALHRLQVDIPTVLEEALALKPTQAEKRVAAMEAWIHHREEECSKHPEDLLPCDGCMKTNADLDAARKGEA